jgi:fumarate reductase flavoprotein subunit
VTVDFDVIVVGSGGSGLAAALTAAEAGRSVLVVESESRIGGSTRLSDATLMAAGTRCQRRDGIEDSADAMYRYYATLNRWQLQTGLVRAFCEDSSGIVEWLIGLGLAFGPVEFSGNEEVPRGHPTIGLGEALISTLERECRSHGVEFALGNRVEELLFEAGRVGGVTARGESMRSHAVVLAAGGFSRNPALIARFLGGRMLGGDRPETPSAEGCRGDALILGERVGAAIAGLDRAHWVPGPFVPAEAILLTAEGQRFVDESADHSVRTIVANYHGHTYWAVFDENIRRAGHRHPFVARTAAAMLFHDGALRTEDPTVRAWMDDGTLVFGNSLDGPCAAAGLDARAVQGALDRYNEACARGVDRDFEKAPRHLVAIDTPAFYVVRIRPTLLVATFCGLRIDEHAHVLDRAGRPISGLLAAGESAGGVVGDVYAGHGNSVTTALVFGRRAGASAASAVIG